LTVAASYNLAQIFTIGYQYDSMGNRTAMTMKEGTSTPKVIHYKLG
jgi:YD repeat-containing protein